MVDEIIVHFGMHKTGSTSIQKAFARDLDDPRFHYINLGEPNQSRYLITLFTDRPHLHHTHIALGVVESDIPLLREKTEAEFLRELRNAEGRKAILSAEVIGILPLIVLKRLYAFLSRHARRIRAVGYVRSPRGYVESLFQQRVKGGLASLDVARLWPSYRESFAKLEQVFGKSQVEYWLFDPTCFPDQDVVRDFAGRMGVAWEAGRPIRCNEGLSLGALKLLYALRRHGVPRLGPESRRGDIKLIQELSSLPGPKLCFGYDLVAQVLDERVSDMRWMEDRLGEALDLGFDRTGTDCIQSETDLLRFQRTELSWLAGVTGKPVPDQDVSADEVGRWVAELRDQLVSRKGSKTTETAHNRVLSWLSR